ncbi:hypothetical protein LIER_37011 [Lithospermum erythrorhizon]|uniref:Reverse transcriptase Ty1/copia-type domain-containing protein n=1 Tax=Lithospermum erythrorhizon TaxID=34254 RepID=A0AAV3PDY8_LITER
MTGGNEGLIRQFKNSMIKEFDMTDLGGMSYFLGIEVLQKESGIFICQKQYAETILKGSLMYLTRTRPYIMFATCVASRYMASPTELHLQLAKRILRYLKGTLQYGIMYKRSSTDGELMVYTDRDYAGDIIDRKTCVCQALWMKRILSSIDYRRGSCTVIKCDNSSTIKLSKNPVMHGRCKHIDVRYHFLRDRVKEGVISLIHCGSAEQVADIMTKALKVENFQTLRAALGMIELSEVS